MSQDPRYDSWLSRERVEYEYRPSISLSRIDERASLENQGRVGPAINSQLVEQYRSEMERGAVFPALIVHPKGDNYVIIDGNQRFQAAKLLGRTAFDAYVVRATDEYKLDLMKRTANLIESAWPPSRDARLQQAEYWHRTKGVSVAEAARLFLVDAQTLGQRVNAHNMETRLMKMRKATREPLQTHHAAALNSLKSDNVLAPAAWLVEDAKLATIQVSELVRIVQAERTEADQIAAVSLFAERPEIKKQVGRIGARGKKPHTHTGKQQTMIFLASAHSILQAAESFDNLGAVGAEDRQDLHDRVASVVAQMRRLQRINDEKNGVVSPPLATTTVKEMVSAS